MVKDFYKTLGDNLGPHSSTDEITDAVINAASKYGSEIPQTAKNIFKVFTDPDLRKKYDSILKEHPEDVLTEMGKKLTGGIDPDDYDIMKIIERGGAPRDNTPEKLFNDLMGRSVEINNTFKNMKSAEQELLIQKEKYYINLRRGLPDKDYKKGVKITGVNNLEIGLTKGWEPEWVTAVYEDKTALLKEKTELLTKYIDVSTTKKPDELRKAVNEFDALYEVGGKELIEKATLLQQNNAGISSLNKQLIEGTGKIISARVDKECEGREGDEAYRKNELHAQFYNAAKDIATGGKKLEDFGDFTNGTSKALNAEFKDLYEKGEAAVIERVAKLSLVADVNNLKSKNEVARDIVVSKFSGGFEKRVQSMMNQFER